MGKECGGGAAWYKRFFDEDYFEMYSNVLSEERTLRECDQIEQILALPKGSKILDLCCGHGRHSVELAKRGYRMVGLDLSEVFLKRAKEDAAGSSVEIEWVHSDMRQIPFANEFDAVINIFTAFGYLERDEEDEKVIQAAANSLKSGGKFLIETISRDSLMRRFQRDSWIETPNGWVELFSRKYDAVACVMTDDRVIIRDGERKKYQTRVRLYTPPEYARMLGSAELEVLAAWGGLDQSELTMDSRRLVVLAQKNS